METLKNKSTGTAVKILQTFLDVEVDGKFGPKTAAALNEWKTLYGITPDGTMSTTDWKVLAKTLPTIRQGDKSKYVKMWQLFLGIEADGDFGSHTKASTRAFQSTAKLGIDGVVGPITWQTALCESNTKPTTVLTANKQPINYKQYDSRWSSTIYTKNNTYNKSQTIRNSGCGPTAMADIVATWWDNKVTPKTLAALSVANGYRTENSGTAWDFFRFCAQKYGARKFIQTSSYTIAAKALNEGACVICSMGPGLYTKQGHFICWWKTDGTYNYVNDPASSASARAKSKCNIIKTQAKQYFIFYK